MNVAVELDRDGAVTGSPRIAPAVIRSRARLEYGQVDALLGGGSEPRDLPVAEGDPSVVAESLAVLDEVAYKRRVLRHRRGVFVIDIGINLPVAVSHKKSPVFPL